MNRELLEKIVNAVLYEGYILYPYRPSVKNHQRWTFGGLYPESCDLVRQGAESCVMQTQCLVEGPAATLLRASVRFLHLTTRVVGELPEPVDELPASGVSALSPSPGTPGEGWGEGDFERRKAFDAENHPQDAPLPQYQERERQSMHLGYRPVDSLRVGGKIYQTWQEASEREVAVESFTLGRLTQSTMTHPFAFSPSEEIEPLRREDGRIVAVLVRRQEALGGVAELSAAKKADDLFQISVRVINLSPMPGPQSMPRDAAQLYSLASTHTILSVEGGAFASSIDPPPGCLPFAGELRNIGSWPVLVGVEPDRDTVLASPIILYDYPQIAPESPGNLYDSTEIDEILSLRIMTLTDDEKLAVAGSDEGAARILQRTDALGQDQMASLHGTLRGLRTVAGGDKS